MSDLDMARRTRAGDRPEPPDAEPSAENGLSTEQINPRRTLSPKLLGALGGALATMAWIVLANEIQQVSDWTTDTMIAATGASATLLTFLVSYLVGDPLRQPVERRSLRRH